MNDLKRLLGNSLGFSPLEWWKATRRMRDFVRKRGPTQSQANAVRFLVAVIPWLGTAVPWFSMASGVLLGRRGHDVTFVIDDIPFGAHFLRQRCVVACLRSVSRLLRHRYDIVFLTDHVSTEPIDADARAVVERFGALNAVWAERGEMRAIEDPSAAARATVQLARSWSAIGSVIAAARPEVLFVPGGVWGSSGLWVERGRKAGLRIASFDSGGYGLTLMLSVDGIACQLQDIPRAFKLLKAQSNHDGERSFIKESALAEIGQRRAGVDKFSSQVKVAEKLDPRLTGAVLLATNSSWDSAALGLHHIFESSTQWIVETIRYLLDHTAASVIVRQHPAERLDIARTSDDYRGLLDRHFGHHPRLHFIAADEPVNSYELLEQVSAVIAHTSTIGIEAAAFGKPVITASNSYYSTLGFVRKAVDLADYQHALSDAAQGRLAVTEAMQEDALCCYYLTQCCYLVFSPFNPEAFHQWSRFDPQQLALRPEVHLVLDALDQNVPVPYLAHRARFEHRGDRT